MTTDLYALIEKQRLDLETKLAAEVEKRDVANRAIKAIRAQIDDLPVRKARRTKRAEVRHKRALEAEAVPDVQFVNEWGSGDEGKP